MKTMKNLYSYYLILPAILIYSVFFVVPAVIAFYYSFTDWRLDRLDIRFIGWENFSKIFSDKTLTLALKNTVIFAVVTVVG
ncbi:MAG: sugar ABC transporter permease, partial [Paenibacillus macerans]|nr:sugar ABC transporter permease [Paenibacillus macerans]